MRVPGVKDGAGDEIRWIWIDGLQPSLVDRFINRTAMHALILGGCGDPHRSSRYALCLPVTGQRSTCSLFSGSILEDGKTGNPDRMRIVGIEKERSRGMG